MKINELRLGIYFRENKPDFYQLFINNDIQIEWLDHNNKIDYTFENPRKITETDKEKLKKIVNYINELYKII